MNKIKLVHNYDYIISIENLLLAWKELLKGKRHRRDMQEFESRLMDNIISLHTDLAAKTYIHGDYQAFKIYDPKPRDIHKASVRDRLLHHTVYRLLYPFFDRVFISDSFSCRKNKGTHKSLDRFRSFAHSVSKNNMRTCWILKCDIKKFFAGIDQDILLEILRKYIPDEDTICLLNLKEIIFSFCSAEYGTGLPLGNLTSQLFANIYMNKFDQFVKHRLKIKYYIRYSDDFVILSENKEYLENIIGQTRDFLRNKLKLTLHPDKIFIKTLSSGMDFLGWKHFFNRRILRNTTRLRAIKNIQNSDYNLATLNSYFGLLGYGNTYKIKEAILRHFLF